MRTLNAFIQKKFSNRDFKQMYDRECHVCKHTLSIFEKAERDRIADEQLAALIGVDPAQIADLRDADYCEPEMVHDLCRRLNLRLPQQCPRRK